MDQFAIDSDEDSDTYLTNNMAKQIEGKGLLKEGAMNMATDQKKYPKGIFFIVGNEFCERFSYYGMRAILVIYLMDWLQFDRNLATAVYHTFIVLCYFSPLFGAVIADGYWGKYRTILYISIIYAVGNIVMAFTSFPPPVWVGPMIGLLLIGLGTGGIKPCVSAFGGDQFSADQGVELKQFFSIFYFAINLGSLLSMILTPSIRANVSCFGTSCFPLAFGIPAILMVIAVALFFGGRNLYKRHPPTGNVLGRLFCCIGRAIKNRCKSNTDVREHWLDYADDQYEAEFIQEVKSVLRVLMLFLPLPLFWALFDQQGSRWTIQAREMDLNFFGVWHIPPDQMQALNAFLIIALIPLFEAAIYPLCNRCNFLTRPLQRMVAGMLFASLAFIIAGVLQLQIDQTLEVFPAGQGSVKFINTVPCDLEIRSPWLNDTIPASQSSLKYDGSPGNFTVEVTAGDAGCAAMSAGTTVPWDAVVEADTAYGIVLASHQGALMIDMFQFPTKKPENGGAYVGLLYVSDRGLPADANGTTDVTLVGRGEVTHVYTITPFQHSAFKELPPDKYSVLLPQEGGGDVLLEPGLVVEDGGVYTVTIQDSDSGSAHQLEYIEVPPNQLSVLWQVPQYVLLTVGEVLFSISGLTFAYSQAPQSMKSVMQAGWLLTVAVGNLVDVIVAGGQWIPSQSGEFFFFAGGMALVTVIFAVMTHFYTYVSYDNTYDLQAGDGAGLVEAEEVSGGQGHEEDPRDAASKPDYGSTEHQEGTF